MNFKICLLLLLFYLSQNLVAQSQKYWVFFTDKDTIGYDYNNHLSSEAIINRNLLKLPLTQYSDIPVNSHYLSEIKQKEIQLIHTSKWLNAVSVKANWEQLEMLKSFEFIQAVEPITESLQLTQTKIIDKSIFTTAISQMQPEAFQKHELDGEGITIGVIDAGFYKAHKNDYLDHLFEEDRILGMMDYVNPEKTRHYEKSETSSDSHGTQVLKMITGVQDSKGQVGFATQSKFYLARTDDGNKEFRGEEDYWIRAMEWMDSLGVRIINTSLGYALGFDNPKENYSPKEMNGKTSRIARACNIAAEEKGILLVVSAGNEGNDKRWIIVSTPGDSQNVMAVGATNSYGLKAGYSSEGPDFLPYLKPNISCFAIGGTSFAAPIITGYAACLMQYKPSATNKELFKAIEKSAHLYPYGNNYVGFGTPKAAKALALLDGEEYESIVMKKQAKGKTNFELQVKDGEAEIGVVFHKSDERMVIRQQLIEGDEGKFQIKKYTLATHTTVIVGEEVFEIFWE